MAQFESSIKFVPYSQERVYSKLEDLNNLSGIKNVWNKCARKWEIKSRISLSTAIR